MGMMHKHGSYEHPPRYVVFPREEWAQLRGDTPLTLSEGRLVSLRSLNDRLSLHEVEYIYLPRRKKAARQVSVGGLSATQKTAVSPAHHCSLPLERPVKRCEG